MSVPSGTVSGDRPVPTIETTWRPDRSQQRQLARWGGFAGLAGVVLMLAAFVVVIGLGLPDASDPETLTDFADIETGRILEHFFYLGAVVAFALHVLVLDRVLESAHRAAALFGVALSVLGLTVMAAGALLHVSTVALADLYTDPGTAQEDLPAIEYAWHGAQSVFDTMLMTGLLVVPVGMLMLGVAMRRSTWFGPRLTLLTFGLGLVGLAGATIEIVDASIVLSPLSVLAMVVFHLVVGLWTWHLGTRDDAVAGAGGGLDDDEIDPATR